MADKVNEDGKADPTDRNGGRGVKGYDEKNPNPNDIHSDDPMVAGLANGTRQGNDDQSDDNTGAVK